VQAQRQTGLRPWGKEAVLIADFYPNSDRDLGLPDDYQDVAMAVLDCMKLVQEIASHQGYKLPAVDLARFVARAQRINTHLP
jgi:hypothetical protein